MESTGVPLSRKSHDFKSWYPDYATAQLKEPRSCYLLIFFIRIKITIFNIS